MKAYRRIVGWLTIAVVCLVTGFWTWWGIIENFHEGWYHPSLAHNILLLLVQYLSLPLLFLLLTLLALYYRTIGSGLFAALGLYSFFFFSSPAGKVLVFIPLILLAAGFYTGEFGQKKRIAWALMGLMAGIILIFGTPQLIKVETRFNDHDFGTRLITGNDVRLIWAPQGEGFPLQGTDWHTARAACAHLNAAGTGREATPAHHWRLPTRDELVRSLSHNDVNAAGSLDTDGAADYATKPDKETPLWNPHSPVIYYWTDELKTDDRAFLVAYNGTILARSITAGPAYQGYRCVRDPD